MVGLANSLVIAIAWLTYCLGTADNDIDRQRGPRTKVPSADRADIGIAGGIAM